MCVFIGCLGVWVRVYRLQGLYGLGVGLYGFHGALWVFVGFL